MAGHRDDGTFKPDRKNDPNRKVDSLSVNQRIKRFRNLQILGKYNGINPTATANRNSDLVEASADDLHALTGSIPFYLHEPTQLSSHQAHLQVLEDLAKRGDK